MPEADLRTRPSAPSIPPQKNESRRAVVPPEVGSAPGWPLVLYFHHVRADIDHYTVLPPQHFAHALDLLGRSFRPFDPAYLELPRAAWPDEPTCLLTFDDGYLDVWEHAVPAMEERGWRGVMFVSTAQVGTAEEHPGRGRLEHMTWSQLRDLHGRGHIVANHGVTHRDMSLLSEDEVRVEIEDARARLALEFGPGADLLAYPFGNEPLALETLREHLPPLCFGSVKAPAAPWSERPRLIRRTFLPTGEIHRWPQLTEGWRRQWAG